MAHEELSTTEKNIRKTIEEGEPDPWVEVKLRRDACAYRTNAAPVLGPGGNQKQGGNQASLGRPGSCGDPE